MKSLYSTFSHWAFALIASVLLHANVRAAEDWQAELAKMPVATNSFSAYLTAPVELIFDNLKPSAHVRGAILMPGAADTLYFFNWGRLFLPDKPSVLDVLNAITNRTELRVSYAAPFILLHGKKDQTTDPLTVAKDQPIENLEKIRIPGKTRYLDRPYDRALPDIEKILGLELLPNQTDTKSWHYYRLSLIGYDLNGAELVRAMCYTMKTKAQVDKVHATFTDRPALP